MATREKGPSEPSLALASVLVAGVVGVFGPLITWRATRDSRRTATRAEFVRNDRTELRAILDDAALALNAVNSDIGPGSVTKWVDDGRPLEPPQFRRDLTAVDRSRQWLVIRLGTDADASKQ
jgi:hypothetical protein